MLLLQIFFLLSGSLLASGHAQPLVCPELDRSPTIDGHLSEKEWKKALVISSFHDKQSGEPAPAGTAIYLFRHQNTLLLGAELTFPEGHSIQSFSKEDDDSGLWEDDGMEIFVSPGLDQPGYFQLIVNSDGRVFDGWSLEKKGAVEWDLSPRPKVAAKVSGQRLFLEAAFPLAAFTRGRAPGEGDIWEMKFCRTFWDRRPGAARRNNVYTTHTSATGNYSSRPYARIAFSKITARTRKRLAGPARNEGPAHPIHRLFEAQRTRIWAKPYKKLFIHGQYQSERLIFHDTLTGAEIWRLTFDPFNDGVSYANRFPWNANGSWLKFGARERMGGYWHNFITGDGEHVTAVRGANSLADARWRQGHPNQLLAPSGRSLVAFDIETGKKKVIASLPDEMPGRAAFGPKGRYAVACKKGFGEGGILTVLDLSNGETRRIKLRSSSTGDFSKDWLYSGGITYIGKEPYAGYSLNHLPHLSRANPYQQWVMNLRTGKYRLVKYLSHGGTSPSRDRKVGYSGESIYTTDFFGEDKKFVMNIGTGGHIPWMSSPEWCLAGNGGAPGSSRFACQLVQVYVNTGNWCRIACGQTRNTTYASYLFANTSPDGTKAEYSSTMLGPRDMYWAVMNWPLPPRNLRGVRRGRTVTLEWDRPSIHDEIQGTRVWRSGRSGGPYLPISGTKPVEGLSFTDNNAPAPAYYMTTSVEYSTLESHFFSNEVAPAENGAWPGKMRWFFEAEAAKAQAPFAVNFHGSASNHRFIQHRHGKGTGRLALQWQSPMAANCLLWLRARAAKSSSALEAKAGGTSAKLILANKDWSWLKLGKSFPLSKGSNVLVLTSSTHGIAIDRILVTDDAEFKPGGTGGTPGPVPGPPNNLVAKAESPFEIHLAWKGPAKQLLHHFNIYRLRKQGQAVSQESLVASPSGMNYLDWGLEPGQAYEYAVAAVGPFGQESQPVRAVVSTASIEEPVVLKVEAETGSATGGPFKVVKDKDASGGAYVETPPEKLQSKYRLKVPFEVRKAGRYVVWFSAFPLKDSHIYLVFAVDGKPNGLLYEGSQRGGSTKHRLMWRPLGVVSGVTPFIWNLEPGRHTLEIGHVGKPGFVRRYHAIDKFIITNDLSFRPPGPTWDWE